LETTRLKAVNRLLRRISRLHHARAHALLEELGLYRGQPPLLWNLAKEPGLSQTELAARLHVTPATVSRMVQRMGKAGVVEARADAEDHRVSRVFLTAEGLAIHERAGEVGGQLGAECLQGFSAADVSRLEGLLARIHANLVAVNGERPCDDPNRSSREDPDRSNDGA